MASFRFLPLLFMVFLSACGAAYEQVHYVPPETAAGRYCLEQCQKSKAFCRKDCNLDKRSCTYDMQAQAIRDYEFYLRDQVRRGEALDLHARDFERPEKCEVDSCLRSCEKPYFDCYRLCGGEVKVQSTCRAFCF